MRDRFSNKRPRLTLGLPSLPYDSCSLDWGVNARWGRTTTAFTTLSATGTEQQKWICDTKTVLDGIILRNFSSLGCKRLQEAMTNHSSPHPTLWETVINHLIKNAEHCCTNNTDVEDDHPSSDDWDKSPAETHTWASYQEGEAWGPFHCPTSPVMFRVPSPCGWREGPGRAASSSQGSPWSGASRQVGATAMELPLDITIIPDGSTSPEERDFKPHKLSPPSPFSPSLIKIEGTHVPISYLLEGCCGVYASSLYTGTKFEYHLHLSGRQWILHQTHGHSPPPLLRSKAPSEAAQMTFPGNETSHLYVFTSAWSGPSPDRGPPQLERHSERLLIKLLLAKSGLHMHRRAGTPGGAIKAATSFASVCP